MKRNKQNLEKRRHNLIFYGLLYVKPELRDEWITFALANTRDWYSLDIIEKSILMMEQFDRGTSYKEAREVCDENKILDKRSEDYVDQTIEFFYNKDQLRKVYCEQLNEYGKVLK